MKKTANESSNNILEDLPSDFPKPLHWIDILSYLILGLAPLVSGFYLGLIQGFWISLALFFAGFVFWTFIEYIIHRYIFHPWKWKKIYRLVPRFLFSHGLHHKFPVELKTGLIKVYMGMPILMVFFILFYLIFRHHAFVFTSGFIFGYLYYGVFHFYVHHFPPPFWMQALWRHHDYHHHQDPKRAYGVTIIFWDFLFGTLPPHQPKA